MLYTSEFSDKNGKVYEVQIRTGTTTTEVPITLSGDPVVISSSSDNIFAPIKSRSCTIAIVSDSYIFDLYQSSSRGGSVAIRDESNNTFIFKGYIVPNVYDQSYTNLDTIQVEARDAVSTLQDFRFKNKNTDSEYRSLLDYILSFLKECTSELIPGSGYQGNLYIPEAYDYLNNNSVTDILSKIYASEANWFEDTEEHKGLKKYEVLEEILRFMNWTLCPFGDDVYIVDYRLLNDYDSITYTAYNIQTGTKNTVPVTKIPINITCDTNAAPGTPNLSLDEVYNKIEISDNLYEIDEISPDIFENTTLTDVIIPGGTTITLDESQWVRTTVTKHFLAPDTTSTEVTGYEYQTVSLLKPESGWQHHFYQKDNFTEITDNVLNGFSNCYDTTSTSQYKNGPINKYCNSLGAIIQRYAYRANDGVNNLPTSLDWIDYLTFFLTDETVNGNGMISLVHSDILEKPVLEYEVGEQVMWKPSSGTSWITIKGDLFYQYNNVKYGDKNKSTLNIINTTAKYYTTAPVDKASEIQSQNYLGLFRDYDRYKDTAYGQGFSCWKMKLQIGNRFWNGTSWTSGESTFYLKYNNNPSNHDDESLPAFGWASIVSNTDYTDKVGENAYCIPIRANDVYAPSFGKMKLTIYAPRVLPVEYVSLFSEVYKTDVNIEWQYLPPVIYCKDFEIDYKYTDSTTWYSNQKDSDKEDVVYTNLINDSYTNEFDKIELKLNSQLKDKPISRSYACSINDYVKTMKHKCGDESKTQEKNIIDSWYWHHYQPKKKYDCNIHGIVKPDDIITANAIAGRFLIDRYTWNMRDDNIQLNLIEY